MRQRNGRLAVRKHNPNIHALVRVRQRLWLKRATTVLATLMIRESSDSLVVVMKSIQYRKRNDLSSSIGQGDSSSRRYPLTDP